MFSSKPRSVVDSGNGVSLASPVHKAVTAFRSGRPVLIHDFDDREGETDLVYPALSVTPLDIARLRNDAGGLICVALSHKIAESFELPFLSEELDHPASEDHNLGYDERSSFSLSVNHRDTYTGITDQDRALTITRLGETAVNHEEAEFINEFRAPGHVHLLKAAPNLLADRQGHTELGIELANRAGRASAVVVCEMLDDRTGEALSRKNARCYARRHNLSYVEGRDILQSVTNS